MTDEELAAIKSRCFGFRAMHEEPFAYVYETTGLRQAVDDNEALVAEVERLRRLHVAYEMEHTAIYAENAAMREIVQFVANGDMVIYRDDEMWCLFGCQGGIESSDEGTHYWQHTPDCPVTKARALLGEEEK